MTDIVGYDNQDDFDADVAAWDAANPGNPMIDDELESQRRTAIVAAALENYAAGMRVNRSMANIVWSPSEAYNVCAESVQLETGCRLIDALVVATIIANAIITIDENWPTT